MKINNKKKQIKPLYKQIKKNIEELNSLSKQNKIINNNNKILLDLINSYSALNNPKYDHLYGYEKQVIK